MKPRAVQRTRFSDRNTLNGLSADTYVSDAHTTISTHIKQHPTCLTVNPKSHQISCQIQHQNCTAKPVFKHKTKIIQIIFKITSRPQSLSHYNEPAAFGGGWGSACVRLDLFCPTIPTPSAPIIGHIHDSRHSRPVITVPITAWAFCVVVVAYGCGSLTVSLPPSEI